MILNRFKTETFNGTDNNIRYHWRSRTHLGLILGKLVFAKNTQKIEEAEQWHRRSLPMAR